MIKKNKRIILSGLVLLAIVIGVLIFISVKNNKTKSAQIISGGTVNVAPTPKFMSIDEKNSLNLPADSKIQILKTDAAGKAEVYRVIRRDADIVLDPSRVGEPGMVQSGSQPATK